MKDLEASFQIEVVSPEMVAGWQDITGKPHGGVKFLDNW